MRYFLFLYGFLFCFYLQAGFKNIPGNDRTSEYFAVNQKREFKKEEIQKRRVKK